MVLAEVAVPSAERCARCRRPDWQSGLCAETMTQCGCWTTRFVRRGSEQHTPRACASQLCHCVRGAPAFSPLQVRGRVDQSHVSCGWCVCLECLVPLPALTPVTIEHFGNLSCSLVARAQSAKVAMIPGTAVSKCTRATATWMRPLWSVRRVKCAPIRVSAQSVNMIPDIGHPCLIPARMRQELRRRSL